MTASSDSLGGLHDTLATALGEAITNLAPGDKGLAAIMEVARKFLADNGIDANVRQGSPLGKLVEKVTQFPFDPAGERPN